MGNCSSGIRCDKCDGAHPSAECPIYTKPREDHPDAQQRRSPTHSETCDYTVTNCTIVNQPADNHCLFHCLAYNLRKTCNRNVNAKVVRAELAKWVLDNPHVEVKGRRMGDLLREEYPEDDADTYAKLMASSQRWGGFPELVASSRLYDMNVRVWVRTGTCMIKYKLISKIESDADEPIALDLLYNRRMLHYDSMFLPAGHPFLQIKKKKPKSPSTSTKSTPEHATNGGPTSGSSDEGP